MRMPAALGAAALVVALLWSKVPWAALLDTVRVSEPWHGPVMRVVVEPGQTLWHLARTYRSHDDPRQVIDWIRSLNPGLDPGRLQIGQVVLVPVEMVEIAEEVR